MGQALYRSYRSKSFDEVVGQEHITETLKNSVKNGTFVHAYLLTGPRGVGKTSVARILAHEINETPYPADPPHVDIIEIDAASNRRIDEIRELRERVVIAPTNLKYKVYIIDEVHMLTKEAFNALLKTLEEPPEHVIFILATTDFHKVPDTIVSRCIRLHFRPISEEDIEKHLSYVAKKEKIKISAEALKLIASSSGGSFRDAIALLDQLRASGKAVEKEDVGRILGIGSEEIVENILTTAAKGKSSGVLAALDSAYAVGAVEKPLAHQLITALRESLISGETYFNHAQTVELIDNLLDVDSRGDSRTALEVALLRIASEISPATTSDLQADSRGEQQKPSKKRDAKKDGIQPKVQAGAPKKTPKNDLWAALLSELKEKNKSLYSIARMAKTKQVDEKTWNLEFAFAFHARQMNQAQNKQIILGLFNNLGAPGQVVEISVTSEPKTAEPKTDTVKDISNIFGASELLES